MRAGELRNRIALQRQHVDRNELGESVGGWKTFANVYAAIRPASSREILLNQAVASQVTHAISIRYCKGVDAKCRAIFHGRTFDVAGVINVDERNVELRLLCFETGGTA